MNNSLVHMALVLMSILCLPITLPMLLILAAALWILAGLLQLLAFGDVPR